MHLDLLTKILLIALATNAITRILGKLLHGFTLYLLNGGPGNKLMKPSMLLGELLSCPLCLSGHIGIILGLIFSPYTVADIPDYLHIPLTIAAIIGLADAIRRRD